MPALPSTKRCQVGDTLVNWEKWGKLVKTWATGRNYFKDGQDYSLPASLTMSIADFKNMLDKAGRGDPDQASIRMTIPPNITTVKFVQGDDNTLVIRIPPKAMVEDSEQILQGLVDAQHPVARYPLPIFYVQAWNPGAEQLSLDPDSLMTMHCQRIGEYTINLCA
jgi:hypothetical protein